MERLQTGCCAPGTDRNGESETSVFPLNADAMPGPASEECVVRPLFPYAFPEVCHHSNRELHGKTGLDENRFSLA